MTRTIKILIGLVIFVSVMVVAAWLARPAYHRYKENRALNRARTLLAAGNIRDAAFNLRQALTLNPTNLEAVTLMANVFTETRSPAAIAWRQRAMQLSPTVENTLLFGSTALQFERPPYPITAQALEEVKFAAPTNVTWHLLASQLALRRGQTMEAAAQIEAASKLEPTNRLHQMNLAVLNLQSTNVDKANAAREQLAALTSDPVLAQHATRSLIADSVMRKQYPAAKELSARLLARPEAQFPDRIQHLTILTELNSPEAGPWLGTLKTEASTNVLSAAVLVDWMNSHQQAKQARQWITSLPATMRSTFPIPLVITAGYVGTNDWRGLETWLTTERWNDEEYLRFAWLTRALREQSNRSEMADIYWRRAVSAAEPKTEALVALAQLTASWNWDEQSEDLLRMVTKRDPSQEWAWDALRQRRQAAGDTAGLQQIYSTLYARNTNSVIVKNNLAMLDLLMNQNTNRAFLFAKEVYLSHTNIPEFVSTEAFALYRQNRSHDALQLMQSLPDQTLLRPDIALYYSIMLAANGQKDSAAPYQAAAIQSPMLPEEKRLLEKYFPRN